MPLLIDIFANKTENMSNESSAQKFTDVNELGEFGLIEHLTKDLKTYQPSSVLTIGDDAAVIDEGGHYTLVSTDSLVEGIHFDLMYTPLKHLGYKSVIVNLSDIYAMNGRPRQIVLSLAFSSKYTVEALEEFYSGVRLACDQYKVDLVGGDMTSAPRGMMINITAIGWSDKTKTVFRSGAQVGDFICVTGDLGGAYLGLQILEREKEVFLTDPNAQPELDDFHVLVGKQLKPEARADAIDMFEQAKFVPTSMIDISDGLASELFHICQQSKTGALIEESKVPIHSQTEKLAFDFRLDPITCALSGGEDYELLFTARQEDFEKVKYFTDTAIIGKVTTSDKGIKLLSSGGKMHTIKAQGWNHFQHP
jgi:thiamine-monophosphate kinase